MKYVPLILSSDIDVCCIQINFYFIPSLLVSSEIILCSFLKHLGDDVQNKEYYIVVTDKAALFLLQEWHPLSCL